MALDRSDDRLERGQFLGRPFRGRIAVVAQAIAAMEPVRALVRAIQGLFGTHEHGNLRAAEFRGVERIARGLLNGDVSRNCGNRQNTDLGRSQRHDQSNGVIGSRVGVNQEEWFHAA